MEEGEYRSTYHSINTQRCIFEKSVLSRKADCKHAHRFCLADREGISCQNSLALTNCKNILDKMRENALFTLQLTRLDGQLPHAKEVKVQMGGLHGLLSLTGRTEPDMDINDIASLIEKVFEGFGGVENLPYHEITKYISKFKNRKRARQVRD